MLIFKITHNFKILYHHWNNQNLNVRSEYQPSNRIYSDNTWFNLDILRDTFDIW